MLTYEGRTQMDTVCEFRLARSEKGRARFTVPADVGKDIQDVCAGTLRDGAQIGVMPSISGPQIGNWYGLLNIRIDPNASNASRDHTLRVQACNRLRRA